MCWPAGQSSQDGRATGAVTYVASPAQTAGLQTGPAYGGLKAAYVNRRDHQPLSLDFADHHPEVANILHTLIPWNCWWCACALAQPPYHGRMVTD